MPDEPGPDRLSGDVPMVRLDPAARDRAVEAMTRAFTEDRISDEILEAGLDLIYRATTLAELERVTARLPVASEPIETSPAPVDPPALAVTAWFSGHEQSLRTVPRELRVRARFGYVELDLRDAEFGPGITEIDVRAFAGYVQLRLPDHVRIESRGRGVFGFFSARSSGSDDPEAPVVRLSGRALFGFAECLRTPQDAGDAVEAG